MSSLAVGHLELLQVTVREQTVVLTCDVCDRGIEWVAHLRRDVEPRDTVTHEPASATDV